MEACVSTSRVLLPFPLCAARPADAFFRRRAGASRRRGVGLNPATASLDSAAVLLDATVGAGTGYSQARYYTSLGFFVLSVPGLWLLIKRSVKSKVSPGLSSSVLASLLALCFLVPQSALLSIEPN
ncbi:hypothetical protein VPH35_027926 [Triticum aestivum]